MKAQHTLVFLLFFLSASQYVWANPADSTNRTLTEDDFYKIITIPLPEGVILEAGGLAVLPDGKVAVATRRGEVWMISNALMENRTKPHFKRIAQGLHEPLGLTYRNGSFYLSQRSELTKLTDTNGDEIIDRFETVYSWPLSGNYHEYSYGPLILPDGNMVVTLNVGFFKPNTALGASRAKWRGWTLVISPDGKMTPLATGMRSPAGVGFNAEGDIFYAENQGDWIGSGGITHVEKGDFTGNPAGLQWAHLPESPVKLRPGDIQDYNGPMHEVAKTKTGMKTPAVWFPHSLMGISNSDILANTQQQAFGPFENQLLVGDQGHSKIMRVCLEKVNGKYQGAVFPFREGFASGVLRLAWAGDASLFVGMTSRGWASTGPAPYGLQRLTWTGKTPFEIKTIAAKPDGFELTFTLPVDKNTAQALDSYSLTGFSYKYHHIYGSPVIGKKTCPLRAAIVSEDGLRVRLVVDSLREGYIHEIKAEGVLSRQGISLLHKVGYYTLNNIPSGEKLAITPQTVASHQSHSHQATVVMTSQVKKTTPATHKPDTERNYQKRLTEMPQQWVNGPDQTITLGTQPGLKFDLPKVEVRAGSKVRLVFNNNDDMLHNFVLVKPGTAIQVGELAMKLGLDGARLNYIPESDKVLYHTALLQPDSSESIFFEAPATPGDYIYVCTYPGHAYVMQGVMRVRAR